MAKVHRSYRLEERTVSDLAAWAEAHGKSTTQAVEELLTLAMRGEAAERVEVPTDGTEELQRQLEALTERAEALKEQRDILRDHLADVKQHNATLTAEVHAKNEQIAEKDRQMARIQDTADHAQMLEAAHVAGAIAGGTDVSQDEAQRDTQRRGFWAWVARKVEGK